MMYQQLPPTPTLLPQEGISQLELSMSDTPIWEAAPDAVQAWNIINGEGYLEIWQVILLIGIIIAGIWLIIYTLQSIGRREDNA